MAWFGYSFWMENYTPTMKGNWTSTRVGASEINYRDYFAQSQKTAKMSEMLPKSIFTVTSNIISWNVNLCKFIEYQFFFDKSGRVNNLIQKNLLCQPHV